MYKKNKIIAIIPARAGSKGVKSKNLQKIGNNSLVEHTINQAKFSRYIDMIAVSTDSKKIQNISIKKKVWCDVLRPKKISGDQAETSQAIEFTLKNIKNNFDYIVELHPTHVFRNSKIIDQAIKILLSNKKFDSLISILEIKSAAHPEYAIRLSKDKSIKFKKSPSLFNRHNLSKKFMSSGIIIISKVNFFLRHKKMCYGKCYGFVIKDYLIQNNIDNYFDLEVAKFLWGKYGS